MSPIELEAARRLLFLTPPEAAATISNTSEQAWRRWEAGTRTIPDDVADCVRKLLNDRNALVESLATASVLVWPDVQAATDLLQARLLQSACAHVHAARGTPLQAAQSS